MYKMDVPDKDVLYHLYAECGKSLSEVAVMFGTTAMTVRAWLNKYDIKTRVSTINLYSELRDTDFSDFQKSVLLGSVLGDGCLRIPKHGKNASFCERHCAAQKQYVYWKHAILKPFSIDKIDEEAGGPHVISGIECSTQATYKFKTISHQYLTQMWKRFYQGNGNKVIPNDIANDMNMLVFAIWVCDDGALVWNNIRRTYRLDIHTEGFSYDENLLLARSVSALFSGKVMIIPRQYKSGTKYYLSLRGKSELHSLLSQAKEFVPECMVYKFETHI